MTLTPLAPQVQKLLQQGHHLYRLSHFSQSIFDFPTKLFETESYLRSFKSAWFERWKWLHYDKDTEKALCLTCWSVVAKKLVHELYDRQTRSDHGIFIKGGFSNWRKATEKFKDHEKSSFHLEAVNKIAALNSTPISALLSDAAAKEQNTARVALQETCKSVRYLGRQSLPAARRWMLRRDNWLSDTIQNEIIELLAHAVQQRLVSGAMVSHYFGLTADGTTDISSSEQFSCHVHYVDSVSTECVLGILQRTRFESRHSLQVHH